MQRATGSPVYDCKVFYPSLNKVVSIIIIVIVTVIVIVTIAIIIINQDDFHRSCYLVFFILFCWWRFLHECLLQPDFNLQKCKCPKNDLSHALSVSLDLDVKFQITCNKALEF